MRKSSAATVEQAYFPLFLWVAEETYVLKVDVEAHQPGTMAAPGAAVSEADETNPMNLLVRVNDDNDDGGPAGSKDNSDASIGPNDNDIVKVALASPGISVGTMDFTVSPASKVQMFIENALPVGGTRLVECSLAPPPLDALVCSVNLASPTGDLAGLVTPGGVNLYLEGMAPAADVTLKLVYKNATGTEGPVDEAHLGVFKVLLKEVSFAGSNYHAIKKDDGSLDYTAPHWQDNSSPPDGDADDVGDRKYPISFTRNTKMKLSAKWHFEPANLPVAIKVRGDGPGNLDFPETTAAISGNDMTITDVECSNAFANTVGFFDPMSITWTLSFGSGVVRHDAGVSVNQAYVTLGDPLTTVYHTLVHIGCKNANGQSSVEGTADGVYGEFTDREVRRLSDNKQMTYWFNNQMGATETAGILQRPDANGNCQAWSALLRDSFKVQGIPADRIRALPVSMSDWSILVKDWQINNPPSGTGRYPYVVGTDAFDLTGIAGQGNVNPPGAFNGHWITLCNGSYYDGSYGTAKVTGSDKDKAYEDGSLDGYGQSLPPSAGTGVRKNDVSSGSTSELDYQLDN